MPEQPQFAARWYIFGTLLSGYLYYKYQEINLISLEYTSNFLHSVNKSFISSFFFYSSLTRPFPSLHVQPFHCTRQAKAVDSVSVGHKLSVQSRTDVFLPQP